MPVMIRVMNWNIEQLSWNKINKPGMLNAIARTVNAANIDVLILLEVKLFRVSDAMTALSAALGSGPGGNTGAATNWRHFFLSYRTGAERYCVFIRNLDVIRPLYAVAGTGPAGMEDSPLDNLQRNVFGVWPHADWTTTAYAVPAPRSVRLPLLNLYATERMPRAAKAQRTGFVGQPLANGGYSIGRGFRLPALAMLMIHSAMADYLVPIIMCHYASGAVNAAALGQIAQLKFLHLAQLFNSNPGNMPAAGQSGYIDVLDANGANTAWPIQELAFTGDFNLDFLANVAGGQAAQTLIHNAYVSLTPTLSMGGSTTPSAAPGVPVAPPPAVPFNLPQPPPPGPMGNTIPAQDLRTAVTRQGTIMAKPAPPAQPAGATSPAPYVTSALDNFFYGGTNLAGAIANVGPMPSDSGGVVNVPASIVNAPVANPADIDLTATAQAYALTNTKNAQNAPNLQGGGAPPPALTALDRLIGARLVSDHLPIVLEFSCP